MTIVFIEFVEFTPKAAEMKPEDLVGMLNGLFVRWDEIATQHGIEKGDCCMAACGVPVLVSDHAKTNC